MASEMYEARLIHVFNALSFTDALKTFVGPCISRVRLAFSQGLNINLLDDQELALTLQGYCIDVDIIRWTFYGHNYTTALTSYVRRFWRDHRVWWAVPRLPICKNWSPGFQPWPRRAVPVPMLLQVALNDDLPTQGILTIVRHAIDEELWTCYVQEENVDDFLDQLWGACASKQCIKITAYFSLHEMISHMRKFIRKKEPLRMLGHVLDVIRCTDAEDLPEIIAITKAEERMLHVSIIYRHSDNPRELFRPDFYRLCQVTRASISQLLPDLYYMGLFSRMLKRVAAESSEILLRCIILLRTVALSNRIKVAAYMISLFCAYGFYRKGFMTLEDLSSMKKRIRGGLITKSALGTRTTFKTVSANLSLLPNDCVLRGTSVAFTKEARPGGRVPRALPNKIKDWWRKRLVRTLWIPELS